MSTREFESVNPANEKCIGKTPVADAAAIEYALQQSDRSSRAWALTSMGERSRLLNAVADQLISDKERLAKLITAEMGKLIGEARSEVEKCVLVCRYYADNAQTFLADEVVDTEAQRTLVSHQPLGTVLAVMPWNFPLWQVFRFAVPTIAAGNVGLLKHASNVMLCSEAIEDVFRRAGAPEGLFVHLPIQSSQVADLIEDPRVRAVTLTGSESAGRAVASQAGKALKKSVLELGGSDPFIVLGDANIERAVQKAVQSRFMNAGQSCIAAKRFIVVDKVAEEFEQRFAAAVGELECGDPSDERTTLAPMARSDLREELHAQVVDAVDRGATVLTGGTSLDSPGYFYQATVLSGITKEMRVFSEETFGPVASVLRADDEEHALQLANDSEFGLGGSVWTEDRERGLLAARRLECGCAFVNELVKSDPRVPFGGIKTSGYGRELAKQGILEFVNTKTIWVE